MDSTSSFASSSSFLAAASVLPMGDYSGMKDTARSEEFEDIASILMNLKHAPYYDVEGEIEDGDAWSASSKKSRSLKRKTSHHDDEEDGDSEEENRKHSDQEDYLMEQEEDDDEWMENSVRTWTRPTGGFRKKAPSGTACEKHKRWKKRCPETCPMRDPKYQSTLVEDNYSALVCGDQEWDDDDIMRFVGVIRDSTRSSKFGNLVNKVLNRFEDLLLSSKGITKPKNHREYSGMVKWCLNQLKYEESLPILEFIDKACLNLNFQQHCTPNFTDFDEEHNGVEDGEPDEQEDEFDVEEDCEDAEGWTPTRPKRDDTADSSPQASPTIRKRDRNGSNKINRKSLKLTTIACERHTSLHARCPPNCADRRPAKPHPRSKRLKIEGDEQDAAVSDSKEELSPQTHEEDENRQQSVPSVQVTRAGRVVKSANTTQSNDEDILENNQEQYQQQTPVTSPTTARKQQSSSSSRKYLPQACQRHRMLHARCPANCPDRIKRDNSDSSPISSPPSNYYEL